VAYTFGQGRRGNAFTLVELMVVVFIIGILVALVVGVGKYVYDEAARKETRTTLTVVSAAIEQYKELTGDYPLEAEILPDCPANSSRILLHWLTGNDTVPALPAGIPEKVKKACFEGHILTLSKDAFSGGQTINDAFGRELLYYRAGGFGGKPVVVSRGPDGVENNEDDIRSDS